jgi:hypothetical protein
MPRGHALKAKTLSTARTWCDVRMGGEYGVLEGYAWPHVSINMNVKTNEGFPV